MLETDAATATAEGATDKVALAAPELLLLPTGGRADAEFEEPPPQPASSKHKAMLPSRHLAWIALPCIIHPWRRHRLVSEMAKPRQTRWIEQCPAAVWMCSRTGNIDRTFDNNAPPSVCSASAFKNPGQWWAQAPSAALERVEPAGTAPE